MSSQYLLEEQRSALPASWRFAFGVMAGAAVVMVGCLASELAPQATSLFVAPAMTTRPMAVGMPSSPVWRSAFEVAQALPEDTVEAIEDQAVAEAAADDETRVSQKELRGIDGQKTWYPKAADTATTNKEWYVIDAEGLRLGRMATQIARILRGKDKAEFHPAADMGDYVVVINAEKVEVSGRKHSQKLYRRHETGRPGSMKIETFDQLQARIPERIIEKAVKGMLPKGVLGRELFRHLKVYKGSAHPHEAQSPVEFKFEGKLARAAEPVKIGR